MEQSTEQTYDDEAGNVAREKLAPVARGELLLSPPRQHSYLCHFKEVFL